MAEESGFFTSVAGDRKYNAAFFNRKLYEALQREDGVLACDGALEVAKTTGLGISIATGAAMKEGIFYRNTAVVTKTLESLAFGLKRRDRIVLHIDWLLRTMRITVLKGVEAASPVAPTYSTDDDMPLAQVLIEYAAGANLVTLADERPMRAVFITNRDSIDELAEGILYGRVLKQKAEAINSGQMDLSFRKFLYTTRGWTDNRYINVIKMHPNGMTLVMGGAGTDKLWRSDDFGCTWTAISGVSVDTKVNAICFNGNAVFAAGGKPARIYRCSFLGNTWTKVAENLGSDYFEEVIALDSLNMIAGCGSAIYGSTDGGLTWTQRSTINDIEYIGCIETLGNGIVLAVGLGSDYIYRSTDSGATWATSGWITDSPDHIFIKHIGNGIVLYGHNDSGELFRSTNYGLTWDAGTEIDEDCSQLFTIMVDGTKLWLPLEKALYTSINGGVTWTKEHDLANIRQICYIGKNYLGTIITMGYEGFTFWGHEFNV